MSRYATTLLLPVCFLLHATPSFALPTMIRLGYADCATCHVSPQGGGLLTPYGKGVDTAQSLRAGELREEEQPRRVMYDVRAVMGASLLSSPEQPDIVRSSSFRFMLRNAFNMSSHTRVSYEAGLDTATLTSGSSPAPGGASVVFSKALFEYRPHNGVSLQIGRDRLPDGLGLPDPQTFMRRQHDALGTTFPTQAKLFLWNERFQFAPYVFGPGFDEDRAQRQHGGGAVGGVELWNHQIVLGLAGRVSRSDAFDRESAGAFARLGFGRWGILAEHDLTSRVTTDPAADLVKYVTGYTQLFVAPVEWFVPSLIVDEVVVEGTGAKRLYRLSPALSMRISENLTVVFSTRDDVLRGTGANTRTYSVSVAVKTVQ